MGPEVLAKREQMELYYKTAIATVLDPYNITVRFLNYSTTPAADASEQTSISAYCTPLLPLEVAQALTQCYIHVSLKPGGCTNEIY